MVVEVRHSERDRELGGGGVVWWWRWRRGDRHRQRDGGVEGWCGGGGETDTDSERDREMGVEGWWRGDRETQTVSETDREMGGGGVVWW